MTDRLRWDAENAGHENDLESHSSQQFVCEAIALKIILFYLVWQRHTFVPMLCVCMCVWKPALKVQQM